MGGTCSTYRREERLIQCFWWGIFREKWHLGDQGVDGRII